MTTSRTMTSPHWTWDEALTEWEQVLRPYGCTYDEAAGRLGLNPVSFRRQMDRSRNAGDERARPPIPRLGGIYGPILVRVS